MVENPRSELTLSRIWQDGNVAREMRTVDGRRVAIVYSGVWTHQNGPDFRDAMIEIDGRLYRGAVELHLRSSDWFRHGHQHDPAYDGVILHLVAEHDTADDAHGPAGGAIPTVVISDFLTEPLDLLASRIFAVPLGALGSRTCLPTLAGSRTGAVHDVLQRAGWKRLVARQLRFSQELTRLPAAEVLYRGFLDAFGFMQNRAGMATLGERLPLAVLEAAGNDAATPLLVGTAGFLPLSPSHAELVGMDVVAIEGIEQRYRELEEHWRLSPLPVTTWVLNRVRPANHPVRRLASFGALIDGAAADGLLPTLLGLPLDDGRSWREWLEGVRPAIGRSRADQICVNVLAPFLAAFAEGTGDDDLAEKVAVVWERLPGSVDDSVAKAALRQIVGGQRFRVSLAIESQGLHEIARNGCRELRCFECPIAALAVMHEPEYAMRPGG
jgi:hypothetical protein